MAKKKTTATKKATAAKKTSPSAKKSTTASKKQATTAKKTASVRKTQPATATKKPTAAPTIDAANGTHEQNIELLPPEVMTRIKNELQVLMGDFKNISENNLTSLQRRRKIGAGIRNYGFIDKVSDLAEANPKFVQFFDIDNLKNAIRNIEVCRDIVILLQAFTRVVSNSMMVYSDDAFQMALIFYNMVREMSRRGDPEAMEIFDALRPFFRRPRRASAEPTAKDLERDLHALIHGKADGKIVVENETPKITGGARKVVDEVRRGRAAIKETLEEEEKN